MVRLGGGAGVDPGVDQAIDARDSHLSGRLLGFKCE